MADPDGLRLGDLPVRGGAAGERVARARSIVAARGLALEERLGLVVDQGVEAGRTARGRSLGRSSWGSSPGRSLTDCSVYVSVRSWEQGPAPDARGPMAARMRAPTARPEERPRLARRRAQGGLRRGAPTPPSGCSLPAACGDQAPRLSARLARSPRPTTRSAGRSARPTRSSSPGSSPSRAARCGSTTTPTTSRRGVLKDFEEQYDVDIRLSTFNDADEALTKIASEEPRFDLYFPSYDSLGRLVQADLLRPLNHDYLPNTEQPVAELPRPLVRPGRAVHGALHDLQHRHRLADRHGLDDDIAALDNPYDVFWDTAVRRQHGDPRRLAHRDGDGAAAQRHQPTSTPPTPTTSTMVREQLLELATR